MPHTLNRGCVMSEWAAQQFATTPLVAERCTKMVVIWLMDTGTSCQPPQWVNSVACEVVSRILLAEFPRCCTRVVASKFHSSRSQNWSRHVQFLLVGGACACSGRLFHRPKAVSVMAPSLKATMLCKDADSWCKNVEQKLPKTLMENAKTKRS